MPRRASFGFRFYGQLAGVGLLFGAFASLVAYPLLWEGIDAGFSLPNGISGAMSAAMLCFAACVHARERRERLSVKPPASGV